MAYKYSACGEKPVIFIQKDRAVACRLTIDCGSETFFAFHHNLDNNSFQFFLRNSQVPKPISFFQDAYCDEKGVKQIIRLILSKFVRRQPGRSDNDWTNMWLDLQSLLEKAFFFIDLEYVLMEFCRGLLKAGKFSLARNYLKGVGSVSLANDKAENLVIQAAREYFFSASSLSSSEVSSFYLSNTSIGVIT